MQHVAEGLHEALEHGVRDRGRQVADVQLAAVGQVVARAGAGAAPAAAHAPHAPRGGPPAIPRAAAQLCQERLVLVVHLGCTARMSCQSAAVEVRHASAHTMHTPESCTWQSSAKQLIQSYALVNTALLIEALPC